MSAPSLCLAFLEQEKHAESCLYCVFPRLLPAQIWVYFLIRDYCKEEQNEMQMQNMLVRISSLSLPHLPENRF